MKNEGCSLFFSVNHRTPASLWRRLLKQNEKINSFKIIIGFFFTPPLFSAKKVAISFVCYSPKTIKCTQKLKIEKSLQESTNRTSERASANPPHHIYSLLRMRAIHELKRTPSINAAQLTTGIPSSHLGEKRDINSGHVRIYS